MNLRRLRWERGPLSPFHRWGDPGQRGELAEGHTANGESPPWEPPPQVTPKSPLCLSLLSDPCRCEHGDERGPPLPALNPLSPALPPLRPVSTLARPGEAEPLISA